MPKKLKLLYAYYADRVHKTTIDLLGKQTVRDADDIIKEFKSNV